jgi:hypothetical protein
MLEGCCRPFKLGFDLPQGFIRVVQLHGRGLGFKVFEMTSQSLCSNARRGGFELMGNGFDSRRRLYIDRGLQVGEVFWREFQIQPANLFKEAGAVGAETAF